MISIFYKKYLEKLTTTFLSPNSAVLIAKSLAKPKNKTSKWKQEYLVKNANKKDKKWHIVHISSIESTK